MEPPPIGTLRARRVTGRNGTRAAAYEVIDERGVALALVLKPPEGQRKPVYDAKALADLFVASPDLLDAAEFALEEVASITVEKTVDYVVIEEAYRKLEAAIDLARVGWE